MENKAAVITGGNSGIGLATARRFAAEGARVSSPAGAKPLGRLGEPADIANAALFLAPTESSDVNGAEFSVDGGLAQV